MTKIFSRAISGNRIPDWSEKSALENTNKEIRHEKNSKPAKPKAKVRDLKPKKDAKGGRLDKW